MAYRQATPAAQPTDPSLDPFTTPEQLKSQRDMAEMLMRSSRRLPQGTSGDFTAVHPLGGLAAMTEALMGGMGLGATTKQQLAQAEIDAAAEKHPQPLSPTGVPYAPGGAGPQNPSEAVGSQSSAQGPTAQAPAELKQLFAAKEQQYNLPPGYLEGTARIESSFNPRNLNELSGAHGLFQFVKGTAHQYGLHYGGTGPGSTGDPVASTDAAARFAADNMKHLQSKGINPDAGKLYLAHQQGPAGAAALLSNPNAPAGAALAAAYPKNPGAAIKAIASNAGDPRAPAAQFAAHWASKFPQGQQQDFIQQFPTQGPGVINKLQGAAAPQGQPVKVASNAPDAITSHYSQADQDYVNQHQAPVKVAGPPMAPGSPQATAAALAGQPAAQSGQGGPATPPPVQMAAGQGRAAPIQGMPTPQPTVTREGQAAPQGLILGREHMTQERLNAILKNPNISKEVKDASRQKYNDEYQGIAYTGPGGLSGVYYPGKAPWGGPERQNTLMAPPPHYGRVQSGESSYEAPSWIFPQGQENTMPGVSFGGPGSQSPFSGTAPAAAPGTAAPGGTTPPTGPAPDINIGPAVVPGKKSEAEPNKKVAALETGSTMNDAGPLQGMLSTPPPSAKPAGAETPPPKIGAAQGSQTAQQGGPGIMQSLRDFDLQTRDIKNKQDIEKSRREKVDAADIKDYNEAKQLNQTNATTSSNLLPRIKEAQALLRNPNLKLGPGVDIKLIPDLIKSFAGDKDASKRLSLNQSFDKLVSSGILDVIRSKLQGLGPVRNTELALLNKAAESTHNNKEANIFILDMAEKYQNQLSKIGQLTNMYNDGYRPDAKGNMVFVDRNAIRSSSELNEITNRYLANDPLYTDAQIFGVDPKTGKAGTAEHQFPGGIMDLFKQEGAGPALKDKAPTPADEIQKLKQEQEELRKFLAPQPGQPTVQPK